MGNRVCQHHHRYFGPGQRYGNDRLRLELGKFLWLIVGFDQWLDLRFEFRLDQWLNNCVGVKDGTFDGTVVQTPYGPMQVEVVISGGKIASATALQNPGGDRTSDQINAQVVPMLNNAIVQYQTLNFGNVSRATISTNAYKQSAQSALDQAGFTG